MNFDKNYIEYVNKRLINNIHIIGSDNGLSPTRRQAIISTNDA